MSDIYAAHDAAIERIQALEKLVAEQDEIIDREGDNYELVERHWHEARARADKAEARVAELEAIFEWWNVDRLLPPEGHVAVMLPKEDVEEHARYSSGVAIEERFRKACRKALEADDE